MTSQQQGSRKRGLGNKKNIQSQMNLLLRIQLLVVDVRVVIEDDVDGVRIERNLVEDSERQSIAHNAETKHFSTQILGLQGCRLAR
jgi:hypothetical protein